MRIEFDHAARRVLSAVCAVAPEAHVVGGAVRDWLLGKPTVRDIDVAVAGSGYDVGARVRTLVKGTHFVPLCERHATARLIPPGTDLCIDISPRKGQCMAEDASQRDFTINTLAIPLHCLLQDGKPSIVDSVGGLDDLRMEVLRPCSSDAFLSDPARILRAYRFQATLGFRVSPGAYELIARDRSALQTVAGERLRDELFALLAATCSGPAIKDMDRHGVLSEMFPELGPLRGCHQNFFHHLDVWGHTLDALQQFERICQSISEWDPPVRDAARRYLEEELVLGRKRLALLKLAILFHDAGKPEVAATDPDGRRRFHGHERVSQQLAAGAGIRLRLAAREIDLVSAWIMGHMRTSMLTAHRVPPKGLNRLRTEFGLDLIGLLLLFMADLRATRGPAATPERCELASERVQAVLTELVSTQRQETRRPILRGADLVGAYGITEGPFLGHVLRRVNAMHAEGAVKTKEDALNAARTLLLPECKRERE